MAKATNQVSTKTKPRKQAAKPLQASKADVKRSKAHSEDGQGEPERLRPGKLARRL
jgi:hypothetical protein